jgi:hypothetical protein
MGKNYYAIGKISGFARTLSSDYVRVTGKAASLTGKPLNVRPVLPGTNGYCNLTQMHIRFYRIH